MGWAWENGLPFTAVVNWLHSTNSCSFPITLGDGHGAIGQTDKSRAAT
jgi:hypothetical protein